MPKSWKIIFVIIFVSGHLFGQNKGVSKIISNESTDGLINVECLGFIQPESDDINLMPVLSHKISENDGPDQTGILKLKIEAEHQRELKVNAFKAGKTDGIAQIYSVTSPVIGKNFVGNYDPSGCPQDNTIAVSKGGKMVCIINQVLNYYDITSGTYSSHTYSKSLNTFYNALNGIGVNSNLCDPKVIYDPIKDRFIMYTQTCVIDDTITHIILSFSKTNDPAGGWYIYKISGNASKIDSKISTNTWSDYPKIGISTNELFVSVNEFDLTPSFAGVSVYELDKTAGFSGSAMKMKYWSSVSGASNNITGNPFTIMPVSQGQGSSYGPGIWMLASNPSPGGLYGSSDISVYNITDVMTSKTQTIKSSTASLSNSYYLGGRISQKGDTTKLDNGDCRMQNGFYLNGILHCVFTSMNSSNVNCINYTRIDVSSGSVGSNSNILIEDPKGADLCYPAVASLSAANNKQSSAIAFVRCNKKMYPEFDICKVDDSMNVSSFVTIKAGNSFNNLCYDNNHKAARWGDYTGIAYRPVSSGTELWTAGSYGDGSSSYNYWSTYIAQIVRKDAEISDVKSSPVTNQVVAPNPIVDRFKYSFNLSIDTKINITLLDINGKLISVMYNGMAQEGENTFTFNRGALSNGIYFLRISDGTNNLSFEKLVVTH